VSEINEKNGENLTYFGGLDRRVVKWGEGGARWKREVRGCTVGKKIWNSWLKEMELLCHRCSAFGSALLLVVGGGWGEREDGDGGRDLGRF